MVEESLAESSGFSYLEKGLSLILGISVSLKIGGRCKIFFCAYKMSSSLVLFIDLSSNPGYYCYPCEFKAPGLKVLPRPLLLPIGLN